MAAQKRNPVPVTAGSGVESHKVSQVTFAANSTAWQRWATNASVGRMSARQRRAVLLMAIGLAATPEHAFRMLDGRV
jgi:hypothetical protein